MKQRYNLSVLMKRAWHYMKNNKTVTNFAEALRRAWRWIKAQAGNRAKIEAAAAALGIDQIYHSWSGWKREGRQVIHGERATFQVTIDTPERGEGRTRLESFFVYDQTQVAPQ